jgi:hypothetical protein
MKTSKQDKKNPKAKKATLKVRAEEQRKTPGVSMNHNETLVC